MDTQRHIGQRSSELRMTVPLSTQLKLELFRTPGNPVRNWVLELFYAAQAGATT
jgi:hypothetical protein